MQQAWLLRELVVCRCSASDDCLYSLDIIAAPPIYNHHLTVVYACMCRAPHNANCRNETLAAGFTADLQNMLTL